jgi:FSR family fosmidomycin resistance protein-like MFS transporter
VSKTLPRALLLLTLTHGLVDAFAAMVQPLWPDLQSSLAMGDATMQGLFVLWNLATSVSQLAFGYWGDRARGRWVVWAGTAVAVIGMSLLGHARSVPALGALLVLGGLGVAAFHPEAAALAGATAPHDRARAMALFSVGGYFGIVMGPLYSGILTTRHGVPALIWSIPWGLAVLAVLLTLSRSDRASGGPALDHPTARPLAPSARVKGRGPTVGLLLLIGILRTLPMTGVPLAIAYSLKIRGGSNDQIGLAQAVFAAGVGAGSLGCAVLLREVHERTALWSLPVLAAPWLLVCPLASLAGLVACVLVVGLLLGAAIPILTSYGQRLLHDAQRVASALTMGVTWGVGGVLLAGLMAVLNHAGRPGLAFPVFTAATFASGLLCLWLPRTETAGVEARRAPAA